jgi:hypothetical protein
MAAIDEITEAEIWLRSTLTAASAVTDVFDDRISVHPGPRGAEFPRLTYVCMTPQDDLMLVGTDIFWAKLRFVVRAITPGSDATPISAGVAAMHEAIHGKYGFTDNAYIVSCTRIRPYKMYEVLDSVEHLHLGGEYLIQIRPRD